ncbi:hypothetical protein [Chondromyces apiculatus]|nr:hypothetical protein [Chondromyces apiculatus]
MTSRTVLMRTARAVGMAMGLVAMAGCGSESTEAPGATEPGPCAEMVESCLAKQQACVDTGGEARCEACAEGQYAALSGQCEPIGGSAMVHDFEEFTVQPGEEITGLCQSWTLDNPEAIWVNAVVLAQDVASHHSNWTYVPSDSFEGPDGVWPCAERNYDQLSAAVVGGVLYAQSTQATKEVQRFPNNAAVRIPPYARIIGDVHLLNARPEPVTGHVKLTLHALAAEEVAVKLVPFHLDYHGLDIPARSRSRFTGECKVAEQLAGITGKPFEMDIYYLLPHYHIMGRRFFLEELGGAEDGKVLFDAAGQEGEAKGRSYDPPQHVEGAEGFRFGCEFDNTRAERVGWGLGDQEMCEILGFADMGAAFESTVTTAEEKGMDGEFQRFGGECGTLAFPWDHDKEGGPAPQ